MFDVNYHKQHKITNLSVSGMKYQSNLNEIDKSEHKSQADGSSKVYEWPSKEESHTNSKWFFFRWIWLNFVFFYYLFLFVYNFGLFRFIRKKIWFFGDFFNVWIF